MVTEIMINDERKDNRQPQGTSSVNQNDCEPKRLGF